MAFKNDMRPVHPGEVLREDFMGAMGLSANALAKALHIPALRIHDVICERRGIAADTALRLARYFGGDAPFAATRIATWTPGKSEGRRPKRAFSFLLIGFGFSWKNPSGQKE
jgi:addiction module HigA family antidote